MTISPPVEAEITEDCERLQKKAAITVVALSNRFEPPDLNQVYVRLWRRWYCPSTFLSTCRCVTVFPRLCYHKVNERSADV